MGVLGQAALYFGGIGVTIIAALTLYYVTGFEVSVVVILALVFYSLEVVE